MTFSPLNYRPRTSFADVRRPTEQEWTNWTLLPELALWEAVALLCEIEPTSLPVCGVWRIAPDGTASWTFYHRLQAALSHWRDGALQCIAPIGGEIDRFRVRAVEFARWAADIGVEIPVELRAAWMPTERIRTPAAPPPDFPPAQPDDAMKAAWLDEQEAERARAASEKGRALASKRHALTEHTKQVVLAWVVGRDFKSRADAASAAADHLRTLPDVDPCKKEAVDGWLKAAGWKRGTRGVSTA